MKKINKKNNADRRWVWFNKANLEDFEYEFNLNGELTEKGLAEFRKAWALENLIPTEIFRDNTVKINGKKVKYKTMEIYPDQITLVLQEVIEKLLKDGHSEGEILEGIKEEGKRLYDLGAYHEINNMIKKANIKNKEAN